MPERQSKVLVRLFLLDKPKPSFGPHPHAETPRFSKAGPHFQGRTERLLSVTKIISAEVVLYGMTRGSTCELRLTIGSLEDPRSWLCIRLALELLLEPKLSIPTEAVLGCLVKARSEDGWRLITGRLTFCSLQDVLGSQSWSLETGLLTLLGYCNENERFYLGSRCSCLPQHDDKYRDRRDGRSNCKFIQSTKQKEVHRSASVPDIEYDLD